MIKILAALQRATVILKNHFMLLQIALKHKGEIKLVLIWDEKKTQNEKQVKIIFDSYLEGEYDDEYHIPQEKMQNVITRPERIHGVYMN